MAERPTPNSHQLTDNVKLLQKAVLLHQGEVLLLKRAADDKSRPGCWDTPGGNSEWPTGQAQAVSNLHLADICREILEETNLTIAPNTLSHINLVYHETYYEPEREVFTVLFGWKVELPENFDRTQVQISSEHQDLAWVDLQTALNYDFGGGKGEFMKQILRAATQI